jgi:hypothetical protein
LSFELYIFMFLIKRISPYLIAVLNFAVLEIVLKKPETVFWLAPLLTVIILVLLWLAVGQKLGFKITSRFILTYFLLEGGLVLTSLFLEVPTVRHLLIVLTSLILGLYQEYLFRFVYRSERYKAYSLENLGGAANIFSFLLLTLALFGYMVYFTISLWLAIILVLVFTLLLIVLFLHLAKIEIKTATSYLVAIILLIGEFFVLLSWLPFNFYLKALLFTSLYYFLADITKLSLSGVSEVKKFWRPTLVAMAIWVLLFVTGRWI